MLSQRPPLANEPVPIPKLLKPVQNISYDQYHTLAPIYAFDFLYSFKHYDKFQGVVAHNDTVIAAFKLKLQAINIEFRDEFYRDNTATNTVRVSSDVSIVVSEQDEKLWSIFLEVLKQRLAHLLQSSIPGEQTWTMYQILLLLSSFLKSNIAHRQNIPFVTKLKISQFANQCLAQDFHHCLSLEILTLVDLIPTTNDPECLPDIEGEFTKVILKLARSLSHFRFPRSLWGDIKSIFSYLHITRLPLVPLETRAHINPVSEIQKVTALLMATDGADKSNRWFREAGSLLVQKELISHGIEIIQNHKVIDNITLANYMKWIVRAELGGIVSEPMVKLIMYCFKETITEYHVSLVKAILGISPDRYEILINMMKVGKRVLEHQEGDCLTPHGLGRVITVFCKEANGDAFAYKAQMDEWAKVWGLLIANYELFVN